MNLIIAAISGVLFSFGLAIAGMTQPENILAFLDLFGNWDWHLLLVMAGGIGVNSLVYWLWVKKKARPILAEVWQMPGNKPINVRLIIGAVLFGIGWALAGYCPGPAITSIGSLQIQPLVFVLMMVVGMLLHKMFFVKGS